MVSVCFDMFCPVGDDDDNDDDCDVAAAADGDVCDRATVDLSPLESELTHHMDVELEDGAGLLRLLLTISGTCTTDAQSDLANYTPDRRQLELLQKKYVSVDTNCCWLCVWCVCGMCVVRVCVVRVCVCGV